MKEAPTEKEVVSNIKTWIFNDHSFDRIGKMAYASFVQPLVEENERLKQVIENLTKGE